MTSVYAYLRSGSVGVLTRPQAQECSCTELEEEKDKEEEEGLAAMA
jgi:hypothetical protein